MTETTQDLLARLREYWEYDTGHIINSACDRITEQAAEIARLRVALEIVADGHSEDFTNNYEIARAALQVQP